MCIYIYTCTHVCMYIYIYIYISVYIGSSAKGFVSLSFFGRVEGFGVWVQEVGKP